MKQKFVQGIELQIGKNNYLDLDRRGKEGLSELGTFELGSEGQ